MIVLWLIIWILCGAPGMEANFGDAWFVSMIVCFLITCLATND